MNNYELARLIVDDVMKKVRSKEGAMYMECVRGVETLLNNYYTLELTPVEKKIVLSWQDIE